MDKWLTVDDAVRSPWGITEVKDIEITLLDEKYGEPVFRVPWTVALTNAVVNLKNGHWAYGHQIHPVLDKEFVV